MFLAERDGAELRIDERDHWQCLEATESFPVPRTWNA